MRASSPTRQRQDPRYERIRTQVPGRAEGAGRPRGRRRRLPREDAAERSRRAPPLRLRPGPHAEQMVDGVLELTEDWDYVAVSVGVPAPVHDGTRRPRARQPRQGLGRLRLRGRVRQADEGRQRRSHAGARQLRGRAHALPRARHGPRYDDDPRRRHRADGARSPSVPEGTFEDYVGEAALERSATSAGGKPSSRRSRSSRPRSSPSTSCSAAATRVSSASSRRTAGSGRTRTRSSAASGSGSSRRVEALASTIRTLTVTTNPTRLPLAAPTAASGESAFDAEYVQRVPRSANVPAKVHPGDAGEAPYGASPRLI